MSFRSTAMIGVIAVALVTVAVGVAGQSLGTGFSYQGQLLLEGEPVEGNCDLVFTLYDGETGGDPLEDPVTESAIAIDDGRFSTILDFGSRAFDGFGRWIEIAVRCPAGSGLYTTLAPRQRITAVPYAFSGKMTLKTLTLGPRSFLPLDGSDPVFVAGWLTPKQQNSVTWATELLLPDGATVRRLRCRWFDETTSPEDHNAGIFRLELRRTKVEEWPISTGDYDIMAEAEVDTLGFRGTKTTALVTDDIEDEVINVERYVYELRFRFSLHPGNEWEEFVHFGGCHVDYLTATIP